MQTRHDVLHEIDVRKKKRFVKKKMDRTLLICLHLKTCILITCGCIFVLALYKSSCIFSIYFTRITHELILTFYISKYACVAGDRQNLEIIFYLEQTLSPPLLPRAQRVLRRPSLKIHPGYENFCTLFMSCFVFIGKTILTVKQIKQLN